MRSKRASRVSTRSPTATRARSGRACWCCSAARRSASAGGGTTEDGVLQLAGARNAAAEAGIVGNRDISSEILPDLAADFLIVTEANPERPLLVPRLREHPVLATTSAVRDNHLVVVKSSLLTTLSHWNVAGAEQLQRALYPAERP